MPHKKGQSPKVRKPLELNYVLKNGSIVHFHTNFCLVYPIYVSTFEATV